MWHYGTRTSFLMDVVFYVLVMFVLFFIFKILKYLSRESPLSRKLFRGHHWRSLQSSNHSINHASYCSYCESHVMDGFYCDACGVRAERQCIKKVDKIFKCKEVSSSLDGPMKHQWVKGNIPVGRNCFVCDEECGAGVGLVDFMCIWCSRSIHVKCKATLGEVCDFGKYKLMVVPPKCVRLKGRRPRTLPVVEAITSPGWDEWSPLFILGNSKSGNSTADEVMSLFRSVLNPCQVVDISVSGTAGLILVLRLLPEDARPRILVAGGDGTVAWLLSDLADQAPDLRVAVGIVPLGTGNDLSRVLGWGAHEPNDLAPSTLLDQVRAADPVPLDRWRVNIASGRRQLSRFSPSRSLYMYNYLSVGVDALVTLKFHNTRQSPFYIFTSRIVNKLMYLFFGTEQVVERDCRRLETMVELYLDGELTELPAVESVVVLNIPSWGAGVPLWQIGSEEENEGLVQQFDDGRLEVAAIYSSFHIAQLQVGLSAPLRIGHARHVRIKVKSRVPMQVDGEPWMQNPADISISLHNQALVLKHYS